MISQPFTAPETYFQKEISGIWSSFFNLDQIGIDDEFIDLGGHSLVATQILVRVQQAFDVKVSLKDMLTQGTTIRTLAKIVEEMLLSETNDNELEQLLLEMENLSESEIAAMLK
jgi:acyl carrier protein